MRSKATQPLQRTANALNALTAKLRERIRYVTVETYNGSPIRFSDASQKRQCERFAEASLNGISYVIMPDAAICTSTIPATTRPTTANNT